MLGAGDMETNKTGIISIGHRLVNKNEADEESMPEDNKREKSKQCCSGTENCRSREGSTEEAGFGLSMW